MTLRHTIKAFLPAALRSPIRSLLFPNIADRSRRARSILAKAHRRIGVLNHESPEVSGEAFFIRSILPSLINSAVPTLFDVGANEGNYALALQQTFPSATIHAFEPAPETYARLHEKVAGTRVRCVRKGLSNEAGSATIYDYEKHASSQHASLYAEVMTVLHKSSAVRSSQIELGTLDDYCREHRLVAIDFIKIDTEGNELAVLQGAKGLIANGGLPIIQFEFNEMNVIARTFLKDFYTLLEGYLFLRLMPSGLLPLGAYNPCNEIFAFQNFLAIRPELFEARNLNRFLASPLQRPPRVTGQ